MSKRQLSKPEDVLEKAAGQVTEAAGYATGDKTLEAEGRADQRKTKRKTYLVEPRASGEWSITAEGASRATAVYKGKDAAVRKAKELASNQKPSQVLVYKLDGEIQAEQTFG